MQTDIEKQNGQAVGVDVRASYFAPAVKHSRSGLFGTFLQFPSWCLSELDCVACYFLLYYVQALPCQR